MYVGIYKPVFFYCWNATGQCTLLQVYWGDTAWHLKTRNTCTYVQGTYVVCGKHMYSKWRTNLPLNKQQFVVIHMWSGGHVLRGVRAVVSHKRDMNVYAETSCNLRIDPLLPWSLLAPSQFCPSLLGVASTESVYNTHREKYLSRDYVCMYVCTYKYQHNIQTHRSI